MLHQNPRSVSLSIRSFFFISNNLSFLFCRLSSAETVAVTPCSFVAPTVANPKANLDDSVWIVERYILPKPYIKMQYCISCAIHSHVVRVRSRTTKRTVTHHIDLSPGFSSSPQMCFSSLLTNFQVLKNLFCKTASLVGWSRRKLFCSNILQSQTIQTQIHMTSNQSSCILRLAWSYKICWFSLCQAHKQELIQDLYKTWHDPVCGTVSGGMISQGDICYPLVGVQPGPPLIVHNFVMGSFMLAQMRTSQWRQKHRKCNNHRMEI